MSEKPLTAAEVQLRMIEGLKIGAALIGPFLDRYHSMVLDPIIDKVMAMAADEIVQAAARKPKPVMLDCWRR